MEIPMKKVYIVSFAGHYMRGYMVVVARCDKHSKLMALDRIGRAEPKLLEVNRLNPLGIDTRFICDASPTARYSSRIIFNGDY